MIKKLIAQILPYFPKKIVWIFSKRYIAGESLDDAIRVSHELRTSGAFATIDLLGEFITNLDQALENKIKYLEIIERFKREAVNVTFSLKPTCFGLLIDFDVCYRHVREVVAKAADTGHMVCIDMEDSRCVDMEIELYKLLHQEFSLNVGLVLQAYLKRTSTDVATIVNLHSGKHPVNVRLCKGIYREPESIAFKERDAINNKFLEHLEILLNKGLYVGIATHDKFLVDGAKKLLDKYKLSKNNYEFQMLYGVTPDLRRDLINQGHYTRIYVPFGLDWFGYSTRRLKENPDIAGHIIKAMFYSG